MNTINEATVGDTYKATVTCDGRDYTINFYVATRAGATEGMITETMRHFIHAICRVADGDVVCGDGYDKRSEYLPSATGEARVSIWVKASGIPALLAEGMRFIEVCVFTEDCSAQNFITLVNEHINTMNTIIASGAVQLASAPKKPSQPATQPEQQPSALDEHFGKREEQAPKQPNPNGAGAMQPTNPEETPYLAGYNYKLKEEYAKHAGQTVRFDVMKMVRKFDDRDGSPLVQIYSSYSNAPSKYPALDLKVKPNRLEKVDEFTKGILEAILAGAENNSYYHGSFYMFAPDDGNGKVYPVLAKLSPVTTQQPGQIDNQDDNIPF